MSILDDAIRQHLELKRAHGADDQELKRLEDEAFGPPQRPDQIDPFAEAPTEFLVSPEEDVAELPEIGDEAARSGRRPDIADLQEAPPVEAPAPGGAAPAPLAPPEDELAPTPDAPPPSPADAADVPLPPPPGEAAIDLAPPAEEEHPAGEHEIVPDHGPDTEERHAIADQPTQMFDVQAQMDAEAASAPAEQASPTDEELVDAAQEEPHAEPPVAEAAPLAPPTEADEQPPLESRGPDAELAGHPPAEAEPEEDSSEFDFFNEQRLSDELDQALEAPVADLPGYEETAPAQEGGIFDFESHTAYEEDPSEEAPPPAQPEPPSEEMPSGFAEPPSEDDPPAAPEPPSEETTPPAPEPPSEETPHAATEPPSEENDYDFDPDTGHEDVLEDTPRFLEDAPEDDDLWFEQRPPKDFDLD